MRISDWSSDVCSSDLPFLYLGAWYGIGAGAIALGLLATAGHALREPLAQLAASYGSRFELTGFPPQVALAVLAGAVVLGWLGAGFVTSHYLRQPRPTQTRARPAKSASTTCAAEKIGRASCRERVS